MSDLSLPPDYVPTLPAGSEHEANIVKLAREIAMDLQPLDKILELRGISRDKFEQLKVNPYFVRVLTAEREAWESAVNTRQRVEMKAAAMVEEFLPTLYTRMVQPKEDLLKVVKGLEHVSKLANMGRDKEGASDPNDRVTITINMGADNKLHLTKQIPAKVIDHDANELQENLFEVSLESPDADSN